MKETNSCQTVVIYLTNHTAFPTEALNESYRHTRHVDFSIEHLYWLSCREFYHVISNVKYCTPQDERLLKALTKLLEKKGLQSFGGFQEFIKPVTALGNRYESEQELLSWNVIEKVSEVEWKYRGI
ncbi:hypothetical protein [Aquibacillus rhizosphaerae]|uniref:Uncharacterized protein n=1 Tax=Aquibacillus rhizosphaerae TaxID=3051431 RepID=A0ABT7L9B4_9BACI|nr:hypothetical protein [Aquibacillus sp. LR5S19]MDL4842460.1 hypothetical protein [Aquibacillus sp. LR5S19]